MRIDEAIKELDEMIVATEEQHQAVRLGIEALEAYYALRQCSAIDVEDIGRLPSETEG